MYRIYIEYTFVTDEFYFIGHKIICGVLNQTVQKFIFVQTVCLLSETACNPQFLLNVTKITLSCIHRADLKNILKHSLFNIAVML